MGQQTWSMEWPAVPARRLIAAGARSIQYSLQSNVTVGARTGAVSFIHRFGGALNPHIHLMCMDAQMPQAQGCAGAAHCCVIDGVFSTSAGQLRFHCAPVDAKTATAVQSKVRLRVLKLLVRRGHITRDTAEDMRSWLHGGGFSVNAAVGINKEDRAGLERLLRYCARPVFASEKLTWLREGDQLSYKLPKPLPNGCQVLHFTPLELLEKLSKLIHMDVMYAGFAGAKTCDSAATQASPSLLWRACSQLSLA